MEPVNASVAATVTQQLPPQNNSTQQTALASISEVVATPVSSEAAEDATESVQVSNSLGQASEASNLTRSRALELYRAVAALV